MNSRRKNIFLYLIIVIIPIIIGGLVIFHFAFERDNKHRLDEAEWFGTIHQRNWDQFISETVTTLDILSISIDPNADDGDLHSLLKKTNRMDSRYGGLFLLNSNGKVKHGSTSYFNDINQALDHYLQEVIRTKDTVISDTVETLPNGQKIVGIANPILDDNNELTMIIVAQLRVDYMQNIMQMLTPHAQLAITNTAGQSIVALNGYQPQSDQSIILPIDRLPWNIEVKVKEVDRFNVLKKVLLISLQIIIITHILFFLIKYLMLKRQTALEKKENELQKLELVGNLAASTAHEIRNPLTGIKGLVQLLGEKYTSSQDQYYFSVINEEINRINEIVSEFLILGKPTAQKMEYINLNNIIHELELLIRSEANLANVNYVVSMPDHPVMVMCTKDQMKQVILNITKNALESMSNRGGTMSIILTTHNQKCHLKITDTGSGISEDQLDKIFEPFYTSKDTGTGLGLVVCKRILESFQGEILISSNVNIGTEVNLYLPVKS
ncbi:ATP-binding protein [Cytobacillus purgationiresistens]|uniref:histidine kinase n=1 Tax=Cytobacillus purgationiresistens TaxID=863449 RepID=A0ABU0AHZ7_9BACI|nr:ATP-binding protein [Cytobacillus purgationiresistens]MDQ0270690.1 two-component system, sporulation sensor kinase D [Cytobacillus purgationiresistens]